MSTSPQIIECRTPQERRQFIEFQWVVYRDDPFWVPPLISERKAFYDKARNPFFEHSDAAMFMVKRDGKVVGTIVAIQNNRHNEIHTDKTGFFGGFEVLNDYEVAQALFDTACDWVRRRGMNKLRGPTTLTMSDEVGLLIEGFDSEPHVLMTYNPRYYIDFVERYGFRKAMDLWAWWTGVDAVREAMKGKFERVANLALKRGRFTIRNVDFKNLDREIEVLKTIYSRAWEMNWGHVPPTDRELHHLVNGVKQFADPDLIFMAEIEGQPVGIAITLPNVNRPLHKAYPNPRTPEMITLAKFLWYRRTMVNSGRFIALGVLPKHRMSGIDAVLAYKTVETIARKGYIGGEASWILETNDAMNRVIQLSNAHVYKKYRIYDYDLEVGESSA